MTTNLSVSRVLEGVSEKAASIPAIDSPDHRTKDNAGEIINDLSPALSARTSRRVFMNSIVSAAAVSSAIAVASPGHHLPEQPRPILVEEAQADDPIFAAIEANKHAESTCHKAGKEHDAAQVGFREKYGTLCPDALSKEMRAAFASIIPDIAKSRTTTHKQISRMRGRFPDDVVAALHKELNQQTVAYNQTVKPAELNYDQALHALGETEADLLGTAPTTLAGLIAVVEHVCDSQTLIDTVAGDPEEFLQTIARSARTLHALAA
jgi:hypothetical protein